MAGAAPGGEDEQDRREGPFQGRSAVGLLPVAARCTGGVAASARGCGAVGVVAGPVGSVTALSAAPDGVDYPNCASGRRLLSPAPGTGEGVDQRSRLILDRPGMPLSGPADRAPPCSNAVARSYFRLGRGPPTRCYERRATVVNAIFDLADTIITVRSLIRRTWATHRWDTRPRRRPNHQGTGVPSQEKKPPVGPSSGSRARRRAPCAASAGSPPAVAARGLRSVARRPGASALTLKPSSASV